MIKLNKGDILYRAYVHIAADLDEKSTVEFSEWHVTTVNKNGFFLKEKCFATWGKRSKKNGDYGWLPTTSYVREHCMKQYRSQEHFDKYNKGNLALYKSKKAAYRAVLPELKKYKRDATRLLTLVEKKIKQDLK